jgi:hypothetical protein
MFTEWLMVGDPNMLWSTITGDFFKERLSKVEVPHQVSFLVAGNGPLYVVVDDHEGFLQQML